MMFAARIPPVPMTYTTSSSSHMCSRQIFLDALEQGASDQAVGDGRNAPITLRGLSRSKDGKSVEKGRWGSQGADKKKRQTGK